MVDIIPAILETNWEIIRQRLTALDGLVNWVQLDIADGDFVPNITWSDPAALLALTGRLKIEIHLMTRAPELELKDWLLAADRIVFHHEATLNPGAVLDLFTSSPVEKGVALLLETPLEIVAPYADRLDEVQLMGIDKIGQQGQVFDGRVLSRIRTLRGEYPSLNISVDGGVNLDNARSLAEAGANRLVVGSAFWREVEALGTVEQAIHSWRRVLTD